MNTHTQGERKAASLLVIEREGHTNSFRAPVTRGVCGVSRGGEETFLPFSHTHTQKKLSNKIPKWKRIRELERRTARVEAAAGGGRSVCNY